MRLIELNMVTGSPSSGDSESHNDVYRDTDEPGEGLPVSAAAGAPPAEPTTPVMVNVDAIRAFYRRKDRRSGEPRIGTRLTFTDGGGFAVTDTFDVVLAKMAGEQDGR